MTYKNTRNIVLAVLILVLIALPFIQKRLQENSTSVSSSTTQVSPSPADTQVLGVQIGKRTKISGCNVNGKLPDSGCTPGDVFPDVTAQQICVSGYSSSVRNVPESEKNQVYSEYGIISHTTGEYEVDHLISLELGGSNNVANLWPEAAEPRPGFHEKDLIENYLHQQVCNGSMALTDAQNIIAGDWQSVTMPAK